MAQNQEQIDDEGYDRLEELLNKHCAMNLEMLDGFFAALLAGPKCGIPSDYIPEILGHGKNYETAFESKDNLREFIELVLMHWNSTVDLLESEDIFTPMLKEDLDLADGHDWASGFMRGMRMHASEWNEFLNDDNSSGPMIPIFALHYQYSAEPEMRPYSEPPDQEQRKKLIAGAALGVKMIRNYFIRNRRKVSHEGVYRRTVRKVGRNEPCPCGSGEKYKRCCGR